MRGWIVLGIGILGLGCAAVPSPQNRGPLAGNDQGMANLQPAAGARVVGPTSTRADEIDRVQRAANERREASPALRAAEAAECAGLDAYDRDVSPFERGEDIAEVRALYVHISPRNAGTRLAGARVIFRSNPGMTADRMQRILDCQLARNAAMANDVPEAPYCPLVPRGVTAKVHATSAGIIVVLRADDPAAAEDVLTRARMSKSRR